MMGKHDDIPNHDAIPPLPDDPYEWLEEALSRLMIELECCQEHFSNGELAHIVMHLSSLTEGTRQTYQHAFGLMDEPTRQAVIKTMLEMSLGVPIMDVKHIAHTDDGDGYLIQMENIAVPDDLSGLDNGDQ